MVPGHHPRTETHILMDAVALAKQDGPWARHHKTIALPNQFWWCLFGAWMLHDQAPT
jgi:hypothetical protein